MPVRLSRWGSDIKVNGSVEEGLSKGDNIKTPEMGAPHLTMTLTLTAGKYIFSKHLSFRITGKYNFFISLRVVMNAVKMHST